MWAGVAGGGREREEQGRGEGSNATCNLFALPLGPFVCFRERWITVKFQQINKYVLKSYKAYNFREGLIWLTPN